MPADGSQPGATSGGTSRPGARRGARPPRSFQPRMLLLGLGVVAAVLAWAALVVAAIHFGRTARGGDGSGWPLLAGASVAAAGCLFLALMLLTALLRRVGILAARSPRRH